MKAKVVLPVAWFCISIVNPSQSSAQGQPASNATYAQIVRISYAEGDVRINRGEKDKRTADGTWEKAVSNLPLKAGYSLVTGAGRAEVELEDASTFYLGENSVLSLNDLHTTGGVPYTEVALLSGAVSLHVRPYIFGERFTLKTPTGYVSADYPELIYARVNSYLDGFTVTPQKDSALHSPIAGAPNVAYGQTLVDHGGIKWDVTPSTDDPAESVAWDKWVAERVEQRSAAIAEMMKASGLTEPIPGLAEMKGQGRFFDCPPYGTCWEPVAIKGSEAAGGQAAKELEGDAQTEDTKAAAEEPERHIYDLDDFPCSPGFGRQVREIDPKTGKERVISTELAWDPYSQYNWALCHAGSWIPRHRRGYAWVAGHKRHHHPPVRWVRNGRSVGYVPIHPKDVKGRPPINAKEGFYAVSRKDGLTVERIKIDQDQPVELLKSPPRGFRNAGLTPLERADEPHMEAYKIYEVHSAKAGTSVKTAGIPLSFDRKTQSFMMTSQVMQENKSVTVVTPVSNREGTLQARGGGYSGGGGNRSGGGVGFSGGSHGGGGTSGGGFSGGGSHGSGGGSSVSSSSGGGSSGGNSGGSSGGSSHR